MSVYCESRGATGLNGTCHPSPDEQILNALNCFTGNTKKALKLLCKQYIVLSAHIEQEDPVYINEWEQNRRFVAYLPERKFIIRYVNYNDYNHVCVFQWVVSEKEFNL